nr:synaptobrevin, longin-like domain protein [Tanacetum cinerariifolium]
MYYDLRGLYWWPGMKKDIAMYCLSPKSTGFNEFSSKIATALACLATNRTYNFSKMIFDGLVKNVNNKVSKFLMYPRSRIAQSFTLPPVADEPASPVRDVNQGEAFPTDSGFIADQDRATIAKSSTLPYDSAPRVTSPAAEEGSMQQSINELTDFCTSLQRQHSELLAKFQAQEVEINRLKERVKILEDKEGVIGDRSGDDAPIKGRRIDEEEVATKRVSSDTEEVRLDEGKIAAETASEDIEEMATVLTTMDAATVLASGTAEVPTGSGSIPTAGPLAVEVPTGSDVVPTASPVFATTTMVTPYRRRKGKEVMVESKTPKKQKLQEQIDAQIARELKEKLEREDQRRSEQIARDEEIARIHVEEELQIMIDGLDRSNEVISKHLAEYDQAVIDLTIGERIELINELVKYQDHHSKILQHQAQQKKPKTKKQKSDFYMAVIRNNLGWKAKDFKGMSFKEGEAKFKTVWEQIEGGVSKISEGEAAWLKRKGIRSE